MRGDHPPPPGTGHPAYSQSDVRAIRWWLDETRENHFMLPAAGSLCAVYGCEHQVEAETATPAGLLESTRLLHRAFAVTPAPWSERPYAYIYSVAVDDLGRMVAGERLEPGWLDQVPEDMRADVIGRFLGHLG